MHPFYQERELFHPVSKYFTNHGYQIFKEIKIGFCRADLVAFKQNTVTAVELKLSDWKKAVVQAKNYQLAVDYVYLAIPLMKSYTIMRKAEHQLVNEGIGLLTINEQSCTVHQVLSSQKSTRKMCSLTPEECKYVSENRKEKFKVY